LLYENINKTTLPFQKRFYVKKKADFFFWGMYKIYSSLLKEKEKKKQKISNYSTALRFCTNYTVCHIVLQARGVENWVFICPLQ
jgi:hypothetical protein